MKFRDQGQDPFETIQKMWGLRPTVQEQVNHTAHTQIDIPRRQAVLVVQIRLISYLGIALFFVLATLAGVAFNADKNLLALFILSMDVVLVLAGIAARHPRRLLLKRLEDEISDPYHDDTLRELFHEWLARTQLPEPEVRIRREVIPVRAYNGGIDVEQRQEPDEFEDLVEFTREAVVRGLARDTVWCIPNKPRIKLSTGTVVSKPKWNEFCEALKRWGLLNQDNKGSYVWVDGISDNPVQAVEYLEQALREANDELWQPDEPVP